MSDNCWVLFDRELTDHRPNNELINSYKINKKINNNNDLRQYLIKNGNKIMKQNKVNLKEKCNLSINEVKRPNEHLNDVCNKDGCSRNLYDSEGLGLGRLCDN